MSPALLIGAVVAIASVVLVAVPFLREPVEPREYLHLALIFVPAWAWCSERFELHRVRVVTGRALELFQALVWTQAWGAEWGPGRRPGRRGQS